jgi:hypothetical protein
MNYRELNLLMYLETCLVDHSGVVDHRKINDEERELMNSWKKQGLIKHGRIYSKDYKPGRTHWVLFSEKAWKLAHEERIARANRLQKKIKFERLGLED